MLFLEFRDIYLSNINRAIVSNDWKCDLSCVLYLIFQPENYHTSDKKMSGTMEKGHETNIQILVIKHWLDQVTSGTSGYIRYIRLHQVFI